MLVAQVVVEPRFDQIFGVDLTEGSELEPEPEPPESGPESIDAWSRVVA